MQEKVFLKQYKVIIKCSLRFIKGQMPDNNYILERENLFQSLRIRDLLQQRLLMYRDMMFMTKSLNKSLETVPAKPLNCTSKCLGDTALLGMVCENISKLFLLC